MMYNPTGEHLALNFTALFGDNDGAISDNQINEISQYLQAVFKEITDFADGRLRKGYTTSAIQEIFLLEKYPSELCRFRDPTGSKNTPYASVYFSNGGSLKYRMGEGKEGLEKAADLEKSYPSIKSDTLGVFNLSGQTLQALDAFMQSAKFKQNWDAQQAGLSSSPK